MSMPASAMAASNRFLRSSWIIWAPFDRRARSALSPARKSGLPDFRAGDGTHRVRGSLRRPRCTVVTSGGLRRDQSLGDVAVDLGAWPLVRIAVAAATGGEEGHHVAGPDLDLGALADRHHGAVGAQDVGSVVGARLAAMQAPGRVDRALAID